MQATNKIILGTVQFGIPYGINNSNGMPPQEQVFKILDLAFDNAISTLDTAEAYGTVEDTIGNYHRQSQNRFDLISKFKYHPDIDLQTSTQNKTAALGVKELYSYMFHSYSDYQKYPFLVPQLIDLKQQGLIRKVGISIYNNEEFEQVLQNKDIDLIQLPFNLLDNSNLRGILLKEAKQQHKEVHVRSVFLQGLFFKQPDTIPVKLLPLSKYISKLQQIAQKSGYTINELALGYALSNKYIDKVLIGVDSIGQLSQNLGVIKRAPLSGIDELINEIKVKEIELLNPANW